MMQGRQSRFGAVIAMAGGFLLVVALVALAQSSSAPTDRGPAGPEGDPREVPKVGCDADSVIGDTIVDYALPDEGVTQAPADSLDRYLESHGYSLSSNDFSLTPVLDEKSGVWAAFPASRVNEPVAVAIFTELAPDFWVVGSFSSCDEFDARYLEGEVAP